MPNTGLSERGFSGIMKQTIQKQIFQIEHNMVYKNPNWRETDQAVIYKCGRGVELTASELKHEFNTFDFTSTSWSRE